MRYALTIIALAMAGCATTSGHAPTESRSGFDGARVVSIAPHGAACTNVLCPGLGAEWNSKRPETAVLSARVFNAYTSIRGMSLSIDGKETAMQSAGPTDFGPLGAAMRQSTQNFSVPLALVRQIASGQRVWMRVSTADGAIEQAIVDGATDSKALHAMRRFVAQVDGAAR